MAELILSSPVPTHTNASKLYRSKQTRFCYRREIIYVSFSVITIELADADPAARDGNVARLFEETAAYRGNALAMRHQDERTTHAELRERTAAFAGGLQDLGLEPGD